MLFTVQRKCYTETDYFPFVGSNQLCAWFWSGKLLSGKEWVPSPHYSNHKQSSLLLYNSIYKNHLQSKLSHITWSTISDDNMLSWTFFREGLSVMCVVMFAVSLLFLLYNFLMTFLWLRIPDNCRFTKSLNHSFGAIMPICCLQQTIN